MSGAPKPVLPIVERLHLIPHSYAGVEVTLETAQDAAAIIEMLYEACAEAILRCSMSDNMRRQLHDALAKARGDA